MGNNYEKQQLSDMNRAKLYQLALFPMNNGATNVYYILIMNFIAYYANGVIGLALMFASSMVTVMRLFDAVTDPIIGANGVGKTTSIAKIANRLKKDGKKVNNEKLKDLIIKSLRKVMIFYLIFIFAKYLLRSTSLYHGFALMYSGT